MEIALSKMQKYESNIVFAPTKVQVSHYHVHCLSRDHASDFTPKMSLIP